MLTGEKKQEIVEFIADWVLKEKVRQYVILPGLWDYSQDNDAEFLSSMIASASKLGIQGMIEFLEVAYATKPTLLEVVLQSEKKIVDAEKIEEWIAKKKEGQPKQLIAFQSEEEALAEFNKCRKAPHHVNFFLKGALATEDPMLSKVMAEMTADEVQLYSTMENNCFVISPNSYYMDKKIATVLNGMDTPEKLQAFLKATIKREDCKDRLGLYIALAIFSNTLEESKKIVAFNSIFQALKEIDQLKHLFDDWLSWNDGEPGKVKGAMVQLAKLCKSKGIPNDTLGMLGTWLHLGIT